MGFIKHTVVEDTKVLSPAQHKAAQDALRRLGKTSARDLSEDQRTALCNSVSESQ